MEGLSQSLTKSTKHFKLFYLNNKVITSLEANTFKDLVFDTIQIESSSNLTKIDGKAFNGTASVTKTVKIVSNTKLENSGNSLFESLKKFENLQFLQISYNNISGIPDNAFANSSLAKLERLELRGNKIKTLGQNAFRSLDSLTTLSLTETHISRVPDNAFAFDKKSNNSLTIELISISSINGSSFAQNSLTGIQRPVQLVIGSLDGFTPYELIYLDEKIFSKFLSENEKNGIDLYGQDFDCDDCRSYWLIKESKLIKQLKNLTCSNKKKIDDPANFCKMQMRKFKNCA